MCAGGAARKLAAAQQQEERMSAVSVRASRVGARRHTHAGALRAVGRFVRALLDAAASAPAGAVWHAPVPPAARRAAEPAAG